MKYVDASGYNAMIRVTPCTIINNNDIAFSSTITPNEVGIVPDEVDERCKRSVTQS